MAVKHMPMSSLIIGIDLDPIRTVKGCTTIVGDITTQKSRQVHIGVIVLADSHTTNTAEPRKRHWQERLTKPTLCSCNMPNFSRSC